MAKVGDCPGFETFGEDVRAARALDGQILKVKHLQKCFGKAEVLHDLNFTVSAGEVYGLIGQNGVRHRNRDRPP